MFEGEMVSLIVILKINMVKVFKFIKVLDVLGGGSVLVMEYMDMRYLSSYVVKFGVQLVDLYFDNKKFGEMCLKEVGIVGRGGGQEEWFCGLVWI